jgi:HK97 family phage major capsid protein
MKLCMGDGAAIRAADGAWRASGYLVRFTGPEKRDLYREWFDRETDYMLDEGYALDGCRVLFNHGLRSEIGVKSIGRVVAWRRDDAGLFVEALLEEQDEYLRRVMEAVANGELGLGWSSGALPQAVRVSDNGHVECWPIIEASLTHVPAMPFETAAALRGIVDLTSSQNQTIVHMSTDDTRTDSDIAQSSNDERGTIMDKQILIDKLRELIDMLAIEDVSEGEAEEIAQAAYDEAVEAEVSVEEADELRSDDEMSEEAEKAFIAAAYRLLLARRKKPSRVRSIVEQLQRERPTFKTSGAFSINRSTPHTPMRDMFLQVARLNEGSATRSSMRAQNPEIGTLGGYLLGQEMATEILPVLRPRVVAFNAGVRSVEVQGVGSYIVPRATVAPQAYRPGMNEAVPESDGQFDVVIANMRPIASNIRIPRQMLLSQAVAAEEHLRNEMVKSISLKIDQEIFIGAGKATATDPGAQILGIERVLQTNPTYASTNLVTLAANGRKPVLQDLEDALTVLASNDVEQSDEWGWVFHPRVEGVFRSITDTTGQPLLRGNYGEREYERLLGYRKHMSTQIPINRTTGSNNNTSLIFAGRFDFAQYVMSNQIEIIVDEYSQSRNLQVMFTAYTFSDFIVDYPQAFYLINGVTF